MAFVTSSWWKTITPTLEQHGVEVIAIDTLADRVEAHAKLPIGASQLDVEHLLFLVARALQRTGAHLHSASNSYAAAGNPTIRLEWFAAPAT